MANRKKDKAARRKRPYARKGDGRVHREQGKGVHYRMPEGNHGKHTNRSKYSPGAKPAPERYCPKCGHTHRSGEQCVRAECFNDPDANRGGVCYDSACMHHSVDEPYCAAPRTSHRKDPTLDDAAQQEEL